MPYVTRQRNVPHVRRSAFTFIELVMSLTIVAMFSLVAVPRYGGMIARQRLQSATQRILADLSLAARRAKTTGTGQTVTFNVARSSYTLGDLKDLDHRGSPYVTNLADSPYEATIISVALGGDSALFFDGYGVPDADGSIVIKVGATQQTIPITGSDGGSIFEIKWHEMPEPELILFLEDGGAIEPIVIPKGGLEVQ